MALDHRLVRLHDADQGAAAGQGAARGDAARTRAEATPRATATACRSSRRRSDGCIFNQAFPATRRVRRPAAPEERRRPARRRLRATATTAAAGRADPRQPEEPRLPLRDAGRCDDRRSRTSRRRRTRPRSSTGTRSEADEGREPVPQGHHHRRRAAPGADRRSGPRRPTRSRTRWRPSSAKTQPDLHDGRLGSPREHHADPPDRRHARPGGQPEGRDHPAADQVELPRGPVGARVLHLDARRSQGPGRHRAADRRLRAT